MNQHLGFEQPFIVREIGERWGIDRVQEPSGLGDVVSIGLNVLDNLLINFIIHFQFTDHFLLIEWGSLILQS